ncbi:MAG: C1 family peptidase [Thermodesulfobacteriota bacterium]
MPRKEIDNRTFDARPDRIDYRDRPYNPPLRSLPGQYPEEGTIAAHLRDYTETHKLILNQGKEGACTGFGLAAVVNYLLYLAHLKESGGKKQPLKKVSPRMLYHLARIYDEWPGEDYEGSSCRGAMKGWHRHGVCLEDLWPYKTSFVAPGEGWQQDAGRRPLGAYYRINKDSIADMQAAIYEVGAIYVSATVHRGWFLGEEKHLPVIALQPEQVGGHAFAITGYTGRGFIIQNSWGPKWGYKGFAILPYEDWVQHGSDAWVAVLGAPMEVAAATRTVSSMGLREVAAGKAEWFWNSETTSGPQPYRNPRVQPLGESRAYEHTLVLGNDGRPINRFLDVENGGGAARQVCLDLPLAWFAAGKRPKLAIYAHGGLNDEGASIKRIRVMAPYFLENDIYPLFITWRTGFLESISGILADAAAGFFKPSTEMAARGWLDDAKARLKEAKDRSLEAACERMMVKPVWGQMKQNADAAGRGPSGLGQLAEHLAALVREIPELEIHLIGHSAGSILHGHFLDLLGRKKLCVASCSLYAPACTVNFALQHYLPAVEKKMILAKNRIVLDIMSDERELADTVGPYGKSLLYLVSRALEEYHKMPLLGMEAAWDPVVEDRPGRDLWHRDSLRDIDRWRDFAAGDITVNIHGRDNTAQGRISDGRKMIPLAHGSFDNDVRVIAATLERIRGRKLAAAVENLAGF